MDKLERNPLVRDLLPADYRLLANFSCWPRYSWEKEIDGMFQGLGRRGSIPGVLVRVAEHPDNGELMAAVAYQLRIMMFVSPDDERVPAAFIQAFGVAGPYRLPEPCLPGGSHVGPFFLKDLLETIHAAWHGDMPVVGGRVAAKNASCHRLLDAHGFSPLTENHNGYDTWARQDGLPPDWTRDWAESS
jgi:hypothetical protein